LKLNLYSFIILVIIGVAAVGTTGVAIFTASKVTVRLTVNEKWVKSPPGSTNQIYLFSDTSFNVYQITDEWLYMRFDASNRYAKITVGKTYDVTLVGWRIPFFSMYQNAIEIQEVLR